MEVLSMLKFKEMCEKISPATFIFDTENQPNGMNSDWKFVGRFSSIIFTLNPNRICLKNENCSLCLNRVKSIRFHNEMDAVGHIFSIICGNMHDNEQDITCTIIAECTKRLVN